MLIANRTSGFFPVVVGIGLLGGFNGQAQIDPMHRSLLELGYDQTLQGQGPQAVHARCHYTAYPFVIPRAVIGELRFIHRIINFIPANQMSDQSQLNEHDLVKRMVFGSNLDPKDSYR